MVCAIQKVRGSLEPDLFWPPESANYFPSTEKLLPSSWTPLSNVQMYCDGLSFPQRADRLHEQDKQSTGRKRGTEKTDVLLMDELG